MVMAAWLQHTITGIHDQFLGIFWLCVTHVASFTGFGNLDKALILDLRYLYMVTVMDDRYEVAVKHCFKSL
ncbi:hypothetical protein AN642_00205 [Epulopiscium sp. SCG-B10WGA-EpuloA2]|nr:hypothetical protein AN642_00205 [Epulopiscium sp. SCG-B10WGA-EpuloA2]